MSTAGPDSYSHALHTANIWLADIAGAFGTYDRRFSQRVLRAWLHTLRDRLSVDAATKFGQQLPELLRGVYYDGWKPNRVPIKYGVEEYLQRFAAEAGVTPPEVPTTAATVTEVISDRMSPGQLAEALAALPADLRSTITAGATRSRAQAAAEPGHAGAGDDRIAALEERVGGLTEAVRTLAHGLEDRHFTESAVDRTSVSRAARLADEILIATGSGGTR